MAEFSYRTFVKVRGSNDLYRKPTEAEIAAWHRRWLRAQAKKLQRQKPKLLPRGQG
jgi:hypothetical protein